MVDNNAVHNGVMFGLTALAAVGQFTDTRTTDVALQHGFVEANKFGSWLIKKVGIGAVYAIKSVALPILSEVIFAVAGYPYGVATAAIFAGLGFGLGIHNYLLLRKDKISVF